MYFSSGRKVLATCTWPSASDVHHASEAGVNKGGTLQPGRRARPTSTDSGLTGMTSQRKHFLQPNRRELLLRCVEYDGKESCASYGDEGSFSSASYACALAVTGSCGGLDKALQWWRRR